MVHLVATWINVYACNAWIELKPRPTCWNWQGDARASNLCNLGTVVRVRVRVDNGNMYWCLQYQIATVIYGFPASGKTCITKCLYSSVYSSPAVCMKVCQQEVVMVTVTRCGHRVCNLQMGLKSTVVKLMPLLLITHRQYIDWWGRGEPLWACL